MGTNPSKEGADNNSLTAEEVMKHNTVYSCWIVRGKKVYDVTDFMFEHPGGVTSMMKRAGGVTDCQRDFEFHSWSTRREWRQYLVGKLSDSELINLQSRRAMIAKAAAAGNAKSSAKCVASDAVTNTSSLAKGDGLSTPVIYPLRPPSPTRSDSSVSTMSNSVRQHSRPSSTMNSNRRNNAMQMPGLRSGGGAPRSSSPIVLGGSPMPPTPPSLMGDQGKSLSRKTSGLSSSPSQPGSAGIGSSLPAVLFSPGSPDDPPVPVDSGHHHHHHHKSGATAAVSAMTDSPRPCACGCGGAPDCRGRIG